MKFLNIFFKILAILSVFYGLSSIFIFGFNTGTFVVIFISIILVIYAFNLSSFMRKKIIVIPVIIGFTLCISISTFLYVYSFDNTTFDEDALIILGAGLKGENVSKTLQYRLDKGIEYYNKNDDVIIVVAGGQGIDEIIPEAEAMRNYLVKNNIPEESILMENKSTSTLENFMFSKTILDNYFDKEYTSCFITNDFHIYRASGLNKKASLLSNHYSTKTPIYAIPVSYTREVIAVTVVFIKDIFS